MMMECGDFLFDFLKMKGKKIKYECYLIMKIKSGLRSVLVMSCRDSLALLL